jgi:hypothetical protein
VNHFLTVSLDNGELITHSECMQHCSSNFIDLRHAAQEYPLCRRKLYQLIQENRLPAFRLDGKLIMRRADIEKVITANPVKADLDVIVDGAIRELIR